jgi:hypothetical protein
MVRNMVRLNDKNKSDINFFFLQLMLINKIDAFIKSSHISIKKVNQLFSSSSCNVKVINSHIHSFWECCSSKSLMLFELSLSRF